MNDGDYVYTARTPIFELKIENKARCGFIFNLQMYLYQPRIFVNMKFVGELSIAERVEFWNAIVRNVNEIEITEKDIETLDDYEFKIGRITPAVFQALKEMDITIDNVHEYDLDDYYDAYDKFMDTFVETALLVFIKRVESAAAAGKLEILSHQEEN